MKTNFIALVLIIVFNNYSIAQTHRFIYDVVYKKDVMINEFSGEAKEFLDIDKIQIIFTDTDDKIKKIEFFIENFIVRLITTRCLPELNQDPQWIHLSYKMSY